MRLLYFAMVFFVLGAFFVSAQACVVPEEDMVVLKDTVLCPGKYSIERGIRFGSDNVALDCNGASLIGTGLGYGVLVRGSEGITVRNCNISNYEVGIYLEENVDHQIHQNILVKNRFGIGLFDGDLANVYDNVLVNNSRGDTVAISPIKLFEEEDSEEPIEEPKEVFTDTLQTPETILERSIRLSYPDMEDDEVTREFRRVFHTFFNFTNEHIEIKRSFFYNNTDNSTKVILRIIPKEPLRNVTIYEHIPKCMSKVAEELVFDQDNYEILDSDPLITWHFDELTYPQLITYTLYKRVDERCKKFLLTFGIATDLIDKEIEEKEARPVKIIVAFVVTVLLIFTIVLFNLFRR